MKVRKTVIVDESVWYELKLEAFQGHMGLNEYVEKVFKDRIPKPEYVEGWSDPRDTVIDGDGKTQNERKGTENPIQKRFREVREDVQEHVKSSNAKRALPDDEILTKAQEKLEAVRAERKVETAKGPVKANAALENFFKPQPKAKWKGAK